MEKFLTVAPGAMEETGWFKYLGRKSLPMREGRRVWPGSGRKCAEPEFTADIVLSDLLSRAEGVPRQEVLPGRTRSHTGRPRERNRRGDKPWRRSH